MKYVGAILLCLMLLVDIVFLILGLIGENNDVASFAAFGKFGLITFLSKTGAICGMRLIYEDD